MASYDTEAIMQNVDILTLCDILDIPVKRKGATYFAECVNPDHFEKKIDAHNKLFPDGCHCFSCGKTYTPYGMVLNWGLKNGRSYSGNEIYGILGDAAGGRELYVVKGKYNPKEKFPLDDKMMNLLGFEKHSYTKTIYSAQTDEKGNIVSSEEKRIQNISVKNLWETDKEAFWYIVDLRCKEMYERNVDFANAFANSKTRNGQELSAVFKKNSFEIFNFSIHSHALKRKSA